MKMKKPINTFSSRYGDRRFITNQGGGCYTVEGATHYIRQEKDTNGNLTMFDFDGGPCFFVGEKFGCDPYNADAMIESIIVDNYTPLEKKYISIVDNEEKTTTVYNVKISITVG